MRLGRELSGSKSTDRKVIYNSHFWSRRQFFFLILIRSYLEELIQF